MIRLYALDCGSLSAWQYFAHEEEVDGMLLGIAAWFDGFCRAMKPTHVAACLDSASTRRTAIDPEYKLNRKVKAKPEAFIDQLRRMPDLIAELGITSLRYDGEEADDAIASVVATHASEDVEVIVCTSDKDLGALVSEHCKIYDPRPDAQGLCKYWDVAGITERMGVPPWRVADLLAMWGDTADNIAGIVGIGEKYAKASIQQTKSMAELFRKAAAGQLANLKPATQAKIAAGRDQFDHAMKLVAMRADLPVPEIDAFHFGKRAAA